MKLDPPFAVILVLTGLLISLVIISLAWLNYSHRDSLPACATEDSDNCYWDAHARGNGLGHSFVTIDGVTTYLD